jgi:methionyl-tRNA formyltransferase
MCFSDIVFLTSLDDGACTRALSYLGCCIVVRDLEMLAVSRGRILLSFSTSVVVTQDILGRFFGGCYNIHAASPDYPGRDPHHFAIYDDVTRFGATMHIMTEKVDAGPIVDVEWFGVAPNTRPAELLAAANEAAFRILERVGPRLQRGETLPTMPDIRWAEKKRSRADFRAMCTLSPSISREEFERRFHAFDGGEYDNLVVELHGRTFRIEKKLS